MLCTRCKKKTGFRYGNDVFRIGEEDYCKTCTDALRNGVEEETSRILILDPIYSPSHAAECERGHALVRRNGKWFYVVNYWSSYGAEKTGSYTCELPDDFFCGMPEEKRGLTLYAAEGQDKFGVDAFALRTELMRFTHAWDREQIAALFDPQTSGPEA